MSLAPGACATLTRLDGREVSTGELKVLNPRPVRPRTGWLYLTLALKDKRRGVSTSPIATGIVSGGGRGVKAWVECRLYPRVEFDSHSLDARKAGLEGEVVKILADLIPSGGHLMLDYENAGQEQTFAELVLRVPPAASYLGALMFHAGCRGHFKDWYFSEGGHEGPRKLQANKPPDRKEAMRALRVHSSELKEFIRRPLPKEPGEAAVIEIAKRRAREILKWIDGKRGGDARFPP